MSKEDSDTEDREHKTNENRKKENYVLKLVACRLKLLKVLGVHGLICNAENGIILLVLLELSRVGGAL